MKKQLLFLLVSIFCVCVNAQDSAKWIAYPGEFAIWTHRELMSRRTERNQPVPTGLARVDSPYSIVKFKKKVDIKKPERASLYSDGRCYLSLRGYGKGGILYDYDPTDFELPAGKYEIFILVENINSTPSIYFKSESCISDSSWIVTTLNSDDQKAEVLPFDSPHLPPSKFKLSTKPIDYSKCEKLDNGILYDFGKETFAYTILHDVKGYGKINLYYGESREEALSMKLAETWDEIDYSVDNEISDTLSTKAFRYIFVVSDKDVKYSDISALYEYLPVSYRGSFSCSDDLINKIYDVSYYTLHLCTREVHIDGIKRDRWAWSGDAYQSYLMNFYSFFDEDVNKRTLWGLRGHEPQTRHINTILDYTFYWVLGVYEHYLYTGDIIFLKQIYPRLKSSMDFCIGRLNKRGIAEGLKDDWVFVDWADIPKKGELSFEQLLFVKSLDILNKCAKLVGDNEYGEKIFEMYIEKKEQFDELFWSDDKGAFIHHYLDGQKQDLITKYTNIFAVLQDFVDEDRKKLIKQNAILNDSILQITTPYMKFYELAALCKVGEYEKVLNYMKHYWGGMLNLGATTIWETYDPTLCDSCHYAMYKRPFGKSLCHAWGANPIYLMGRYFLGVYPIEPGYEKYIVEPNLGGLEWMNGVVPTPKGDIKLKVDSRKIEIKTANSAGGILRFSSKKRPEVSDGKLIDLGDNCYELLLEKPNNFYRIKYRL